MNQVLALHRCLKDSRGRTHLTQTGGQHKVSNGEQKSPLWMHSSSPCFPSSSCLTLLILTSHLWAARTDRLHNQTCEPPSRHLLTDQLEGRWFVWAVTRWEAHRSPESRACRLSASADQKSFLLLILAPDCLCTLSICIYSLHRIHFLSPLCASFLPLRPFLQLILCNNLNFLPMFKAV